MPPRASAKITNPGRSKFIVPNPKDIITPLPAKLRSTARATTTSLAVQLKADALHARRVEQGDMDVDPSSAQAGNKLSPRSRALAEKGKKLVGKKTFERFREQGVEVVARFVGRLAQAAKGKAGKKAMSAPAPAALGSDMEIDEDDSSPSPSPDAANGSNDSLPSLVNTTSSPSLQDVEMSDPEDLFLEGCGKDIKSAPVLVAATAAYEEDPEDDILMSDALPTPVSAAPPLPTPAPATQPLPTPDVAAPPPQPDAAPLPLKPDLNTLPQPDPATERFNRVMDDLAERLQRFSFREIADMAEQPATPAPAPTPPPVVTPAPAPAPALAPVLLPTPTPAPPTPSASVPATTTKAAKAAMPPPPLPSIRRLLKKPKPPLPFPHPAILLAPVAELPTPSPVMAVLPPPPLAPAPLPAPPAADVAMELEPTDFQPTVASTLATAAPPPAFPPLLEAPPPVLSDEQMDQVLEAANHPMVTSSDDVVMSGANMTVQEVLAQLSQPTATPAFALAPAASASSLDTVDFPAASAMAVDDNSGLTSNFMGTFVIADAAGRPLLTDEEVLADLRLWEARQGAQTTSDTPTIPTPSTPTPVIPTPVIPTPVNPSPANPSLPPASTLPNPDSAERSASGFVIDLRAVNVHREDWDQEMAQWQPQPDSEMPEAIPPMPSTPPAPLTPPAPPAEATPPAPPAPPAEARDADIAEDDRDPLDGDDWEGQPPSEEELARRAQVEQQYRKSQEAYAQAQAEKARAEELRKAAEVRTIPKPKAAPRSKQKEAEMKSKSTTPAQKKKKVDKGKGREVVPPAVPTKVDKGKGREVLPPATPEEDMSTAEDNNAISRPCRDASFWPTLMSLHQPVLSLKDGPALLSTQHSRMQTSAPATPPRPTRANVKGQNVLVDEAADERGEDEAVVADCRPDVCDASADKAEKENTSEPKEQTTEEAKTTTARVEEEKLELANEAVQKMVDQGEKEADKADDDDDAELDDPHGAERHAVDDAENDVADEDGGSASEAKKHGEGRTETNEIDAATEQGQTAKDNDDHQTMDNVDDTTEEMNDEPMEPTSHTQAMQTTNSKKRPTTTGKRRKGGGRKTPGGPCVDCGCKSATAWRSKKGTGMPQCRPCYDQEYRERVRRRIQTPALASRRDDVAAELYIAPTTKAESVDEVMEDPAGEIQTVVDVDQPKRGQQAQRAMTAGGPCVTCSRTEWTAWKLQKGTRAPQCRSCYDREYREKIKRPSKPRRRAPTSTASETAVELEPEPSDEVMKDAAPAVREETAGEAMEVEEVVAEKEVKPKKGKQVKSSGATVGGPCVTCGCEEAKTWKVQKETLAPQCRSCYDREYKQRVKMANALRAEAAASAHVLPVGAVTDLGRRKRSAPERFGDAITDDAIMNHLGDEDPISEDDEPKAKKRKIEETTATKTKRTRSKPVAPAITRPPSGVGVRLQDTRCLTTSLKAFHSQPCRACIGKDFSTDECRFLGVRSFKYEYEEDVVPETSGLEGTRRGKGKKATGREVATAGPYFLPSTAPDRPLDWPSSWNIAPERHHLQRIKTVVSQAMLPVLEAELKHASRGDAVRRPVDVELRNSCDACATSIFSGSYFCKHCGTTQCFDCYDELKALPLKNDASDYSERPNLKNMHLTDRQRNLVRCRVSRERGAPHYADDFIPMTAFNHDELTAHVEEMRGLAETSAMETNSDASLTLTSSSDSSTSAPQAPSRSIESTTTVPAPSNNAHDAPAWTPPSDPAGIESIPVQHFHHSDLDEPTFRKMWERGETLVVTDVLQKAHIEWSPEYFIQKYGDQSCHIVDCDNDKPPMVGTTVADFFKLFGTGERREAVWKLKDWPSTTEFSEAFPELYEDFHEMVPIPNYTRRDGVLNIASHYPTNAVRPDIGPKMYCALESSELPGGYGSTRLHMDMADAVNIMVHAEPKNGQDGCAVWDIFPASDSDTIRKFLQEEYPAHKAGDPIHAQLFYLNSKLRRKMFDKYGVRSWRIYQRQGEAVFIPAGCAHQVCNLTDAIKVAVDFVSPENVDRCAHLTREFRAENFKRVWKQDVLSLRNTLWYAFVSCKRLEASLDAKVESKGEPSGRETQVA